VGYYSLPILLVLALCGAKASKVWGTGVDDHGAIK